MWTALALGATALGGAALSADAAKDAAGDQTAAANQAGRLSERQFNQARLDTGPAREAGNAAITRIRDLLGIPSPRGDYTRVVDMSGGAPAPVADLYQSDPAYRKAWDDFRMAHDAWAVGQGGQAGFTSASDPSIIEREVRARLPASTPTVGGTMGPTPEAIMAMDPGYQFRLREGLKAGRNIAGARGMLNSGATGKALTRYGQDYASSEFGNIYNRLAGVAGLGQNATNTGVAAGANYAGNVGNYLTGAANARGASAIGQANAYGGALNTVGNYYAQQRTLDQILNANRGSTFGGYGGASPY